MIALEFDKLILQLLPIVKRKPKRYAWLKALIVGLKTLYDDWLVFYDQMQIRAMENSQTMILEKILNDDYDPELRRIKIENKANSKFYRFIYNRSETPDEKVYIYNRSETVATLDRTFINQRSELAMLANSFNVLVPVDIFADTLKSTLIKNRVSALKMATTTFGYLKYT